MMLDGGGSVVFLLLRTKKRERVNGKILGCNGSSWLYVCTTNPHRHIHLVYGAP